MKLLNLKETATILRMTPEGLRKKAIKGEIPGAKLGKCWCFNLEDIADHMRSKYSTSAKTSWGVVQTERRTTWHSTKEETLGGLISATVEKEYNEALALMTK